jgi:hypothetical protein
MVANAVNNKTMNRLQNWSLWALTLLSICAPAHAVNIYLRSGSTTCIFNGTSSQTLQKTSGASQTGAAFTAKTNTFNFYSAPLTAATYIAAGKKAGGTIGVQNNGSTDFQFNARETFYDYNPTTGSQVQIVAGATSGPVGAAKNGKTGHATLPQTKVGGSGYTLPAGHMLKVTITLTVSLNSGINGSLLYNGAAGDGKSLVQFPSDNSISWSFGSFTAPADSTIVVPASVSKNSTGNVASVRDAGVGAVYAWTITNGTITAGQSTRQITWTAGSGNSVGIGITIINGCASSGSASVVALNNKVNQTITFGSIAARTYGDAAFTLSATASSGLPVAFSVASGPATISGNTLTIKGAGTVIVDATQGGNNSYNPAILEQSFTVNPKVLTVSGITASSKVYDGLTDANLNLGGATLLGAIAGDDVTLDTNFTTGDFADEVVGSGKAVDISGLDVVGAAEGNYSLVQPTTVADITAAELTVTGVTANDKVYDGTTSATLDTVGATLVGTVAGDTVTLNVAAAAGSFASRNAGANQTVTVSGLTISGTEVGNYTLTQPATTASILARPLTVSAAAANKTYDGTTVATATLSDNRLAGDSLNRAYASANFADKNVGTGKTVTVSGISVTGSDAANYSFNTSATTTADITPAVVTGSVTAQNKVYDGTPAATIGARSVNGALAGDAVTLTGGSAHFSDSSIGHGKPVTASAFGLTGPNAGNYVLASTTATTVADILPPPVAPTVSISMLPGRTAKITSAGVAGQSFTVQAADSVSGPWTTISSSVIEANGSSEVIDTDAPNHKCRFYRTAISLN